MEAIVYSNETKPVYPECGRRTILLEKKLALIERMRDLTASTELSNSHAEEDYITLMTRREAIMTQLRELDLQLSEMDPEEGDDVLLSQIGAVAAQVLEMDKQLTLRIPELIKGLKNHLKQLKDGKSISRAYHKDIFGIIGEGSINLKK